MGVRNVARGIGVLAMAGAVAGPLLAMAAGAVVDLGPSGRPRLTAFPLALVASDPSAREALRNSLIIAAAASAMSVVIGVSLARVASGPTFWGGRPLASLARCPGAIPPMFAAIGLSGLSRLGLDLSPWAMLLWIDAAWGSARVFAEVAPALGRILPGWDDSARIAGASPRKRWAEVRWPLVRPVAARVASQVFALSLFDPGAPLVLGLRRTLGFRIAQSLTSRDGIGHACALALIGLLAAILARWLLRAWGGRAWPLPHVPMRRPSASWSRGLGSSLVLGMGVALGIAPAIGLAASAAEAIGAGPSAFEATRDLFKGDDLASALRFSLLAGLWAGAGAVLAGKMAGGGPRSRAWRDRASAVSPLALALGVLAAPGLLNALGYREAAGILEPYRSPGVALALVLLAPRLAEVVRGPIRDPRSNRLDVEMARTLGASRLRAAITLASPRGLLGIGPALALAIVRGVIDAGPALILAPLLDHPTLAATALRAFDEPDGLARGSAISLLALAALAIAHALAGLTARPRDD